MNAPQDNSGARLYGILAEYREEEALLEAARRAHGAGYRQIDAFTPFPVEGLARALGRHAGNRLNYLAVAALAVGALLGFGLQYYTSVLAYPINVGGRPLNSWPAFLPLTVETMFLFAGFVIFAGMLISAGLPARHRELRATPHFDLATRNRFFLLIQSDDPQFDPQDTRQFLETLEPLELHNVRR